MNALYINFASGGWNFSDQPIYGGSKSRDSSLDAPVVYSHDNWSEIMVGMFTNLCPFSALNTEAETLVCTNTGGLHLELNHPGNKPGTRNYR